MTFKEPFIFQYRKMRAENTLFMDRDGILIETVIRRNYITKKNDHIGSARRTNEIKLCSDIKALNNPKIVDNWNFVIITNQPDLSYGHIDLQFVREVNKQIAATIPINMVYICPHMKAVVDHCNCRKPKIGLIKQFYRDYPKLTGRKFFIGDTDKDSECASRAHIPFILRKREYNEELWPFAEDIIDNLWELEKILC